MKSTGSHLLPFTLIGLALLILSGCASQPSQGMYWGNYEETLYNFERDGDSRARDRHLATLRRIVDVSESRGWRVPPGVYLELAVIERELGNQGAYMDYVNRGRRLYPESQPFINRWFADVEPPQEVEETDVNEGEL